MTNSCIILQNFPVDSWLGEISVSRVISLGHLGLLFHLSLSMAFGLFVQKLSIITTKKPGGRLNKKDRLTGYGDSHVKDKTSYRPSYL